MICSIVSALAAAAKRPNILFLFADEMDGRIFDATSPQLKPPMPHLTRLAARGALFQRVYNQSPQCVPSRSALMVGLRTDQIEVWDNEFGIAATNGDANNPDPNCITNVVRESKQSTTWAKAYCIAFAKEQNAPPTFIDRLATEGDYNITLYGKMHVGAGLDRFHGSIQEIPFSWASTKGKSEVPRGAETSAPLEMKRSPSPTAPPPPPPTPTHPVAPGFRTDDGVEKPSRKVHGSEEQQCLEMACS